ncbi:MAG: hypothetical protein Q7S52_05380 [bacterium]|nr:hypothetical protein [bacterium]
MEKNDDQTLESGAGEEALDLEPAATTEETLPGGDPLDAIEDEIARAEAKRGRALIRRAEREKKPEPKPAEVVQPTESQFLTKADFHKSNERKAVREATADPEVKANWSEIIPFYTPRRGKDTPEDIREDINDAITLYNARNAKVAKDDSASVLTTTPVVKVGGGAINKETPKTLNPPNFKLPVQPKNWYTKPE